MERTGGGDGKEEEELDEWLVVCMIQRPHVVVESEVCVCVQGMVMVMVVRVWVMKMAVITTATGMIEGRQRACESERGRLQDKTRWCTPASVYASPAAWMMAWCTLAAISAAALSSADEEVLAMRRLSSSACLAALASR